MTSREQTRQNYDRLSRWYDLFAASEKKFTETGLQLLNAKAGERALEIGFGTGHSLITLAQMVGVPGLVVGVEMSQGMIAVARKRLWAKTLERNAQMILGDGTLLPLANNTFDAAFLSFTLELFSEIEMAVVLGECHRVLKSKGRLCVVSLAKQDVLACRVYEWGHKQWPVLLDCRPIDIKNSLEMGGFHIQKTKIKTMWGLPVEITLGRPV